MKAGQLPKVQNPNIQSQIFIDSLACPTVAGAGHQDLLPGEEHPRLRGRGPDVEDQRPAAP